MPVAVLGARGKLGSFVCQHLQGRSDFTLVERFHSLDDWPAQLAHSRAKVLVEATRAGLGFEHARLALEAGLCVVVATSGVTREQARELDELARKRGVGGIVVPNFSLGALLLMRAAEQLVRHFPAVEIVELHHDQKRDAPSGTALETARVLRQARQAAPPRAPRPTRSGARFRFTRCACPVCMPIRKCCSAGRARRSPCAMTWLDQRPSARA